MVGFGTKKKSSKLRGTREHGRGRKKGRGAGLRGGKGNAGAHKHKRVHYFSKLTDGDYWGRKGFKRPEEAVVIKTTINVSEVDVHVAKWADAGREGVTKNGDAYAVDLGVLGFDKLLGKGQVNHKLAITVAEATDSAKGKIEGAGGSIAASE